MTAMQSRPVETRAALEAFRGAGSSLDNLDALAVLVDGAFVVLIRLNAPARPAALEAKGVQSVETPERPVAPKYRRRVFMSAAAAERAARAAVARGETVRVYLAQLAPLHRLTGCEGGAE